MKLFATGVARLVKLFVMGRPPRLVKLFVMGRPPRLVKLLSEGLPRMHVKLPAVGKIGRVVELEPLSSEYIRLLATEEELVGTAMG